MVDFGLSYPIDKGGEIDVDVALLRRAKVAVDDFVYPSTTFLGIVPPEVRDMAQGKINAEKAQIWSIARGLTGLYLKYDKIDGHREFVAKCLNPNPVERPGFDELIGFYNELDVDLSKIEPVLKSKKVDDLNKTLGRSNTEILIPKEQMEQVLTDLQSAY